MKFILYSDLHLRPERQADCLKVLRTIGEAAIKHKAIVINGGDTFHTRGLIRTGCFDALMQEYEWWSKNGIVQYQIIGNHDQEDKAGEIHPMRAFGLFKDWKVIDKPTAVGRVVFFPYIENITEETIRKSSKRSKYAVIHAGIKDFDDNEGFPDPFGIPVHWFDQFDTVWAGHYHHGKKIKNVQFIGSPLQQNFGEKGETKGYWLWDTITGKKEFCEIKGTPKHYDVAIDWEVGYAINKDITENDFVRVKLMGEKAIINTVKKSEVQAMIGKTRGLKLDREITDADFSRMGIKRESFTNNRELIEKYVDFSSTELDKTKLKEIALGLL